MVTNLVGRYCVLTWCLFLQCQWLVTCPEKKKKKRQCQSDLLVVVNQWSVVFSLAHSSSSRSCIMSFSLHWPFSYLLTGLPASKSLREADKTTLVRKVAPCALYGLLVSCAQKLHFCTKQRMPFFFFIEIAIYMRSLQIICEFLLFRLYWPMIFWMTTTTNKEHCANNLSIFSNF